MKIETVDLGGAVTLGVIKTEKFKNDFFGLTFVLPRNEKTVACVGLLANVLKRGTKGYPTFKALSRRLSELYDVSVNVYEQGADGVLLFRISVGFIDDKFIPEKGEESICKGAMDCIREFLFRPLTENGAFKTEYVESERAHRIEVINAEINNKDSYAFQRAVRYACEGTPISFSQNGTVETVNAVSAAELAEMLDRIVTSCRAEAVFAGHYTTENEKQINMLLSELASKRVGIPEEIAADCTVKPLENSEIVETVKARQGRMVLAYRIPKTKNGDMSLSMFTEIFGASPVSRLFMNVRERLSLCYYCSATAIKDASLIMVRSGLDKANREKAIDEINAQLKAISDPANIDDDEMDAARRSLLSMLRTVGDSTLAYSSWYVQRRLKDASTDLDEAIAAVEAVTKEDVAKIAAGASMHLNYFLDGTEGAEGGQ
jgi:predicted Zn-dependent peptidase